MNPRSPTVTLTPEESAALRTLRRDHGIDAAARMVGNISKPTFRKAASEEPIARLSAYVIRDNLRDSLDRIG